MTETETPTKDQRSLAIGLAIGAACCLLYAAFTSQWLVNASRYDQISIGLRGSSECMPRGGWDADREAVTCEHQSNAALVDAWRARGGAAADEVSAAFAPAGWITLVLCVLGAAGLLASAGLALARKQLELPVAPTTVALLGALFGLITGCVFVATKPGPPGFVGVGLSFWLFGIGCVVAIPGAQMLAKVLRPPDPDLLAGSMDPGQY